MAQLSRNLASVGQSLRCKGSQLIAILFVTRKREHLTAQSYEFDAISVIPPEHLHDIARIR